MRTIPIIFAAVGDPAGTGLVVSFARPGGNVTGVVSVVDSLAPKRVELLREILPGVKRLGVLSDPTDPLSGTTITTNFRENLIELANRRRVPVVGHASYMAEAGALFSYGASRADQLRRSAHLVDKILKGAKPADIPVEQPTRFELVINLKTARALGLTIPQSLLLRADEVIQ